MGPSVHICMCGVMEYRASENVTPGQAYDRCITMLKEDADPQCESFEGKRRVM